MQLSKGCVRLRDALKCIGMHLGGYHYGHVEMSMSPRLFAKALSSKSLRREQ